MPSTDDAAPPATPAIDKEALRRRYAAERDKRLRPDGNDQYLRLQGQLAHYLDDPYAPRAEREPLDDHVTVALIGGGFAGLVTAARLVEAGRRRRPHRREGRRLRRHLVLEPLSGRPVRHGVVRLHAVARRDRAHADREVRPRPRDPRALPAHREAVRAVRRRPVPHRGHRPHLGRRRGPGGSSAPTGATPSPRSSSRWAPVRSTCPSCRASPASSRSPATRSTPAVGTTPTPAATRRGRRWTGWPTSGWRSSAPAPPPCSASRTWPGPAASSTCSSAPRRRWTSATTGPPIPSGSPRWPRPAGSSAGSRTSRPTRPAGWSTRTW